MTVSCAIEGQRNIGFFVIMPEYMTHIKLLCDMSA